MKPLFLDQFQKLKVHVGTSYMSAVGVIKAVQIVIII